MPFRFRLSTFLVAVAAVLGVCTAHAAQPGFAFLDIPAGARASAMGGAYSAVVHDADAALWNPAALDGVSRVEVSGSHAELQSQLHYDAVVFGGRLWGGGYGLSMRALYSEAIEGRDESGTLTGTFGSHDLQFAFSYGHRIAEGLSIGGSAQIVRERIADLAAQTYAMDLGATLEPAAVAGSRVSLALQNLGPAAHYTIDGISGSDVPLPTALTAGFSLARPTGHGLTVRGAIEGRFIEGRAGLGSIGAELANAGGMSFRAGWRINDATADLTLGAGYSTRGLSLDYAFIPLDLDLGESHRFSISRQF